MTSFVIYYSTDARKNEIYLLNNISNVFCMFDVRIYIVQVSRVYNNFSVLSRTGSRHSSIEINVCMF